MTAPTPRPHAERAPEGEVTAAVRRAASALFEDEGIYWLGKARVGLGAALDVEEMARVIDPRAFGPITRGSSFARYLGAQRAARSKAAALRAAILGGAA